MVYIRFLKNQPKEYQKLKEKPGVLRPPFESSNYQQQYSKYFANYIVNKDDKKLHASNVMTQIMISNPNNSQQAVLNIDNYSDETCQTFTIGSGANCVFKQADLLEAHAIIGWDSIGWYISQPPKVESFIQISLRDLLYFTERRIILKQPHEKNSTEETKSDSEQHQSKNGSAPRELQIIHNKFVEDKEESHAVNIRNGAKINIIGYIFKCELVELDEQTYQNLIKSQVSKEEYINFEFNIDRQL